MSLYKRYGTAKTYLKVKRYFSLGVVNRNYEEQCIFSNGEVLTFSSGKLAKFSDGCATVTCQDTTIMATAVSKQKSSFLSSFVPLTVSFQNKAAAMGRIPLNFLRREIGQSELEILTARLIDRSIRSSFLPGFNWETQVICNPLALDGSMLPDVFAINAASAALAVSNIPWDGPVGAVRVGMNDHNIIINPTKKELVDCDLNLVVTSRAKRMIVMLEGSANNVLLDDLGKAISAGAKECGFIVKAIENLSLQCGKTKRPFEPKECHPILKKEIQTFAQPRLTEIFLNHEYDKAGRDEAIKKVLEDVTAEVKDRYDPENLAMTSEIFYDVCKNVLKDLVLSTGIRCDGRTPQDLRQIHCEVDLYRPLHGSALFQRGQTQVLCTVALDSPNSALKLDQITMLTSGLKEKNFFVHYQFPAFATNELSRVSPIGRREIGHGCLAEKALKASIPKDYDFTIRLTSEVLESNGSSSMATVCAGSMALMDAGVPVQHSTAGVAIGIMTKFKEDDPEELDKYILLTDILGMEDYFGDMDFKIAGTKKAITALQLDMKIKGLSLGVIMHALTAGKTAIKEIIHKMNEVIPIPRLKDHHMLPSIKQINVPANVRSRFIGPGGYNLKKLEMEMGVVITEDFPGCFTIFASSENLMNDALEAVQKLLESFKEPILEFGAIYTALITEIREHGVMVTLYSNMTPVLIPVSQLDQRKVSHASALGMEVGDKIKVKFFGRDPVSGMMRLSRKVLMSVTSDVHQSLHKKFPEEEASKEEKASKQETVT